mmetsp:Transcript_53980/g.69312  ORF Transcript_53980/g.69312 Transcript_53980/m.69312 type:complete len:135 (+) Transcript_53980:580-984(+)
MFRHNESGMLQPEVPPGFADLDEPDSKNSMGEDDDDDIPDLISPQKPIWSSPTQPQNSSSSFNFAPRSNIFKAGTPPFFSSPSDNAPFTFGSSSPTTHPTPTDTPISVASFSKNSELQTTSTTTASETMGEDEL